MVVVVGKTAPVAGGTAAQVDGARKAAVAAMRPEKATETTAATKSEAAVETRGRTAGHAAPTTPTSPRLPCS